MLMGKHARTGELAHMKSGIALTGKEGSRTCSLLEVMLAWTILNSSSPLTCKRVEGEEI